MRPQMLPGNTLAWQPGITVCQQTPFLMGAFEESSKRALEETIPTADRSVDVGLLYYLYPESSVISELLSVVRRIIYSIHFSFCFCILFGRCPAGR